MGKNKEVLNDNMINSLSPEEQEDLADLVESLEKNPTEKMVDKEKGQELYKKALFIINEKGIWGKPGYGEGFIEDSLFHKGTPDFLGPIDEGTTDAVVLGIIAKAKNCKQFKNFAEFTDTILIFVKKPMVQEMITVTELQEGGKVFCCSPTEKHKIPKRWSPADESQLFDLGEKIDKLRAFLNKEYEKKMKNG